MKKPALVVMAAGIGRRYGGGIKQLAKVGPSGELVIDYSVYDAKEAGFDTVVFIIRKEIEEDFKQIIGDRVSKKMNVIYVYQDLKDLPEGFACPDGRTKPWGTGHAVLCCKDVLDGPFAVINADDYYGKEAFRLIYDYLVREQKEDGIHHLAMAGFILGNTLSDNGTVTRGVCHVSEDGRLTGIDETKEIIKGADGVVTGVYAGKKRILDDKGLVSMNFWGFRQSFMPRLEAGFKTFLANIPEGDPNLDPNHDPHLKEEYLLPIMIDAMIASGEADVTVLPTNDQWFGMTYAQDKEYVMERFRDMCKKGVYSTPLEL